MPKYSREASDGTTETYESREELTAAQSKDPGCFIVGLLAVVGFFGSAHYAGEFLRKFASGLPTAVSWVVVMSIGIGSAYLLVRLRMWLLYLTVGAIALLIFFIVGGLVWRSLELSAAVG